MAVRVAINGFGRIGRLALRAAWAWPELQIVHINEVAGDADVAAHLLSHDSVQGSWGHQVEAEAEALVIDGRRIGYSRNADIAATPWRDLGVDLVVDCAGRFKSRAALAPYLEGGVPLVVVSAPLGDDIPNIVMGVNQARCDTGAERLFSAASCTTNCIAPVVDVLHRSFGIRHGAITTVHDVTNSQRVLDDYHKDLRRARAAGLSLIPTTTGSARAIADIFPDLRGRLNGLAVRVPLANASLSDCVFELERATSASEVNGALESAAGGRLAGILGYETRPLVSVDFRGDPRSGVVDALSTQVIDGTLAKVLVWYDNETGYAHRLMELAHMLLTGR